MDRLVAVGLTSLLVLWFAAPALAADSNVDPDPSASPSALPAESPSASPLPSESPSPLPSESPSPLPSESPSPSPLPSESPSPLPSSPIVLDGVLGVIVLAGDHGPPIPNATVTVTASSGTGAAWGFPPKRTDQRGTVTFTGLPRSTDPDVDITWAVNVRAQVTVVEGDCTATTNYAGSTDANAELEVQSVPVFAQALTSIEICGAEPSAAPGAPGSGGGTDGAAPTNRPRAGGGGTGGAASARPALTPPATSTAEPAPTSEERPAAVLGIVLVGASIVLLGAVARRRVPDKTALH